MGYEVLKATLEQRLADLQVRLSSIKRDASQSYSGDSAEQAQERENDEVVDAIGIETTQSIRVIQSALDRINCEKCGEAIGQARLEAVPEATRCVGCAQ